MKLKLISLGVILVLAGCTNQQVYESVQTNRLNACYKLQGLQRDECMAQHDKPYQEYQREREAIRNED